MTNLIADIFAAASRMTTARTRFGFLHPYLAGHLGIDGCTAISEAEARSQGLSDAFIRFPEAASYVNSLQHATHYMLEQDVVHAAVAMETRYPMQLLQSLPYIHVPAKSFVIEWSELVRAEAYRAENAGKPLRQGAYLPQKVCVHFECDNDDARAGIVRWFWSGVDSKSPVSTAAFEMRFDFDNPHLASDKGYLWDHDDAESQQHAGLYNHCFIQIAAAFRPAMDRIGFHDRLAARLMGQYTGDIICDWPFVVALICMLNSKSATDRKIVGDDDLARLNRARVKSGKPSIQPYSTVRMRILDNSRWSWAKQQGGEWQARRKRHSVIGHWRFYENHSTWIREHFRGEEALGTVQRRPRKVTA